MSEKEKPRREYPPDPNFSGAFAGGTSLMSDEEALLLINDPDRVEKQIEERWRRILEERAAIRDASKSG